MRARQWMQLAAIASALGLAGTAVAADAGTTTAQLQNGMSAGASVAGAVAPGPESVGGSERIDNTNDVPLDQSRVIFEEPPGVYDHPRVIYLLPGDQDAIVVTPDAGTVLDVTPHEPQELYRLPEDRDVLTDANPPPSAGGMQATPGYVGPGSAKGQ